MKTNWVKSPLSADNMPNENQPIPKEQSADQFDEVADPNCRGCQGDGEYTLSDTKEVIPCFCTTKEYPLAKQLLKGVSLCCCGNEYCYPSDTAQRWTELASSICTALRTTAQTARVKALDDARIACAKEALDDPQGTEGDEGYMGAINDCEFAIITLMNECPKP